MCKGRIGGHSPLSLSPYETSVLRFEKDEFQDRVGSNCCRRHVKGKEATSNTKIVANMPTAAAAAAAAATSTFTATVITANIIDQTFTRFFSVGESRHYWYKSSTY